MPTSQHYLLLLMGSFKLSNLTVLPKMYWRYVLGLCGKVLVEAGVQVGLLWEAARSFPYVWWSQCQPAPRRTYHCPGLSPSATVVTQNHRMVGVEGTSGVI